MKTPGSKRKVIEVAALEARRLFCTDGEHLGLGTFPDADETAHETDLHAEHVAASSVRSAIDTLNVPAYSSRPGSGKKLYLDFNGAHSIDAWGGWNGIGGEDVPETPAYDIDNDTNSFSYQELANIQQIWKGVAEKYSPFDIDVTTVAPSLAFILKSGRVVIGGDGAWHDGGGVALVGEFGFLSTAFVWDSPSNPTYVAEAVAHEAGHMLGNNHQSLIPIDMNEYAPGLIMGRGDKGMGRWANTALTGGFATFRDDDDVRIVPNANAPQNSGQQDDVAKISDEIGLRSDDAGNNFANALALPIASQNGILQGTLTGVIERPTDFDFLRFTHNGGSMDIRVLNAEFRGMLDPIITLRNSAGFSVASSAGNTANDLFGEVIRFNQLDAGTYYLEVKGTGVYGDIGQYRVSVTEGQASGTANDTLAQASTLGLFGQTDQASIDAGFAGTALVNDSLASLDTTDFFRFRTPAHTRQIYAQLSLLTTTASLAVYDDLNGDGVVAANETVFESSPSTSPQAFTYNNAAGGKFYYVRVLRGGGGTFGDYQLRVNADAAPTALPPATPAAPFDAQPLVGGRTVYESIDTPAGDTTDYFRATAQNNGFLSFQLFNFGTGDVRLDVGRDTNADGALDISEIVRSSNGPDNSGETIYEVPVSAGQTWLVRVTPASAGQSTNYQLNAIADYAIGGNTDGSLAGARVLNNSAGSVRDYLDAAVDFFDTYRIFPAAGQMQARLDALQPGASHRLEIVRESSTTPTEVVASGFTGQTLTYTVSSFPHGSSYYLRVATTSDGEFPSIGNYRLSYTTAGATTGLTPGAPGVLNVSLTQSSIGGYLGFDPQDPTLTNTYDYYQFTLDTRTRFDASISAAGFGAGVQIGTLDASRNFQRLAGIGAFQGVDNSLSVNLDAGTYILRAYLDHPERKDEPIGGNYQLFWNSAAITDTSAPSVAAAAAEYEIAPVGVSFVVDQDVLGSVDAADVLIRNLATDQTYPIGRVFYDQNTHRLGYGVQAGTLPDGNYRATLLAGSVKDRSNNPLAADYSFDFFILAGDANRDRVVDVSDLGILATNWQATGTFSRADFNYDGLIDVVDLGIVATHWQQSLVAPSAAVAAAVVSPSISHHRSRSPALDDLILIADSQEK